MDGKRKWLWLILIAALLLHISAELTKQKCLIDLLAHIYLGAGLIVALGTGWYYFHEHSSRSDISGEETPSKGSRITLVLSILDYFLCKPFPSKPDVSEDESKLKNFWNKSVLSILETRRNWLFGSDVAIGAFVLNYLNLFIDKRKIENLNKELAFLGFFVLILLLFNHGLASWAYVREVKKCPSVRFSREEGVWLLEVTNEILHRLIQADVLGLSILVILIGSLFNLRY